MPLYTVIMEVDGGTYISQLNATSIDTVLIDWYTKLRKDPEMLDITKSIDEEFVDIKSPILMDGLENVWCASFCTIGEGLGLINIVETVF